MGKYEEALERARVGMPLNKVFPELNESEDERIRKEIIDYLHLVGKGEGDYAQPMIDRWIAYLEKQKEQKPNVELIQKSWYLEGYHDGKYNNEPKWLIQTGKGGPMYEENPKYGTQNPAEWSEEDKHNLEEVISILNESGWYLNDNNDLLMDWLKSLRHPWKPSKEQMETLERWLLDNRFKGDSRYVYPIFESLYNDLKKLI